MWGCDLDPRWTRLTDPSIEPISVREAKEQIRSTQPQGDVMIMRFIRAARDAAEAAMNRGLLTQTWQLTLNRFADVIWLPQAAPLQNDALATPSTAVIVEYYDIDGVLQTLASSAYYVDTVCRPARLLRAPQHVWPNTQSDRLTGSVVITYVVGWTTPEAIPERIKHGIRLYVGYMNADRDGMDPGGNAARMAALACWDDRVEAIDPVEFATAYSY